MRIPLLIGLAIPLLIFVIFRSTESIITYSFFVGLGFWSISGIIRGGIGSGDKARAHYHSIPDADRADRAKWASTFFYLGLPGMIIGLVYLAWGLV